MKQYIYAHRGASAYAPQNTLRAFDLAADMKADGVELDVHFTKDGVLVVNHDNTIDSVTSSTGFIKDYTYDELQQIPITKGNGADGSDRIPAFEDVLRLLKRRDLCVNIELKTSDSDYQGIELATAEMVDKFGMREAAMYSCFNSLRLHNIHTLRPEAKCGMLYSVEKYHDYHKGLQEDKSGLISGREQPIFDFIEAEGFTAIHCHYDELLTPGFVEEAHKNGLDVNPWTVNREEVIRKVAALGVDWIITNEPDIARRVISE